MKRVCVHASSRVEALRAAPIARRKRSCCDASYARQRLKCCPVMRSAFASQAFDSAARGMPKCQAAQGLVFFEPMALLLYLSHDPQCCVHTKTLIYAKLHEFPCLAHGSAEPPCKWRYPEGPGHVQLNMPHNSDTCMPRHVITETSNLRKRNEKL